MFNKYNKLEYIFKRNNSRLIHKWNHYFEIYDFHFKKFKNRKIKVLEIGIGEGGSLQMWKKYFGWKVQNFGIDINDNCKNYEEKRITIIIGNQGDKHFLNDLIEKYGPFDIVIDDGSHLMDHQILTFQAMFPAIRNERIYLCEDLHTSYMKDFCGGYKNKRSFIEFSKDLIDYLNSWHSEDIESLSVNDFTKTTYSMHYYDSILVIEKKEKMPPYDVKSGNSKLYAESLNQFVMERKNV